MNTTTVSTPRQLHVYDPAMCCATGVCGPQVDPVLVRFAGDAKWLEAQGIEVRRFNLAQNPAAFVESEPVRAALTEKGESALPCVLVDGRVQLAGHYPAREELAAWFGLTPATAGLVSPAVAELIAVAAAVAADCDSCLRHHVSAAEKLGVSAADLRQAVDLAAKIKAATHDHTRRLADRLTGAECAAEPEGECCGNAGTACGESGGGCCS